MRHPPQPKSGKTGGEKNSFEVSFVDGSPNSITDDDYGYYWTNYGIGWEPNGYGEKGGETEQCVILHVRAPNPNEYTGKLNDFFCSKELVGYFDLWV
jgi:sugar lactone lactonase YvrE